MAVRVDGDDLVIRVTSPGAFRGPREGAMGLDLVRRRVELAWGRDGRFTIATEGECTVGVITASGAMRPTAPQRTAARPHAP